MPAAATLARAHDDGVGDDDPAAKPGRRRFSAEYKLCIVAEYEGAHRPGGQGGAAVPGGTLHLYLAKWRRARDHGALHGLEAKSKSPRRSPEALELERARRRVERLEDQLGQHRLAPKIRGKADDIGDFTSASELLERLQERRGPTAAVIDECFSGVQALLGTEAACTAVGRARASHYRRSGPPVLDPPAPRPTPAHAVDPAAREGVLEVLCSERFVDASVAHAFHVLLDEGVDLASMSTM